MARLERGLAKREGRRGRSAPRRTLAPPAPSNDRLQSAIEGLRALAAARLIRSTVSASTASTRSSPSRPISVAAMSIRM